MAHLVDTCFITVCRPGWKWELNCKSSHDKSIKSTITSLIVTEWLPLVVKVLLECCSEKKKLCVNSEQIVMKSRPQAFDISCVYVFISEQGHSDADMFFYLLIVFSIISSLYTLIWDLRMDWGLFDRGAGENTFLREEIVYPHKVEANIKHTCTDTYKHSHTVTLILSPLRPGLLLLCHFRRRDPAFCLDNPDLSDYNDQDPVYRRNHSHCAGSSRGL